MLKVVDRFTTRDGHWEPDGKPFSITQIAAEKYSNIPGRGAAHHIFVRVPKGLHSLEFNTENGMNQWTTNLMLDEPTWYNYPIFQGYNPDKGESGAWLVRIDGEKVAEGIGLPYGWHVSTFLVVEDVASPVVDVPGTPAQKSIRLIVDGKVVYESEN